MRARCFRAYGEANDAPLGEIREISRGTMLRRQIEADDYAGGFITFENGLGLQIESFWASHQPGEFQMELFGTEAGAKLHPLMAYRCDDNQEEDIQLQPTERMGSWDRIADHFINCIFYIFIINRVKSIGG